LFGIANSQAHNVLVQGIIQKNLVIAAKQYLKGDMIDIGCGKKPYEEILRPYLNRHVGLDHEETFHDLSNIDLFGTAYEIPSESNVFDSALCSAVLEHLEEPEQALRECNRVLKVGAYAVYFIPFIWHIHEEPRDFYRYSKYGIKYLFEKTNFEITALKALSGFWVTFGQLFVYYLYRFNRGPLRWFKIISLLGLLIQGIVYLLNKIDRTERWTWMYMVIAKKKDES